jgi:hypothetical protein
MTSFSKFFNWWRFGLRSAAKWRRTGSRIRHETAEHRGGAPARSAGFQQSAGVFGDVIRGGADMGVD